MPTYEYRCANCGHQLEAVQSFSDAALTECPQCGEPALRKMFGNVGVVFKGSGFYRNDSRNEAKSRGKGGGGAVATKSGEPASDKPASDKQASDSTGSSTPAAKPASPASGGGGAAVPPKAPSD